VHAGALPGTPGEEDAGLALTEAAGAEAMVLLAAPAGGAVVTVTVVLLVAEHPAVRAARPQSRITVNRGTDIFTDALRQVPDRRREFAFCMIFPFSVRLCVSYPPVLA
jgi:hypothetical protein